MANKPATRPDGEAEQVEQSARQAAAAIGRSVMNALGRPDNFLQVTVRQVSSDNYRVNVVTGTDPSGASLPRHAAALSPPRSLLRRLAVARSLLAAPPRRRALAPGRAASPSPARSSSLDPCALAGLVPVRDRAPATVWEGI